MHDVSSLSQEEILVQQAEHRLQYKEKQLISLREKHLPAVTEERQRAIEVLERVRGGSPGSDASPEEMDKDLDEMLYQVKIWGLVLLWFLFVDLSYSVSPSFL